MKRIIALGVLIVSLAMTASVGTAQQEIPTVLLPVKNSPLITFRIQFAVGSIHDPGGKHGLTRLTASMLTSAGTEKRSYEQLVESLYPMAASIRSQVDKEVTTIVGTIHVDNLEKYYQLLTEVLLEPAFAQSDFERLKTNQLNYLRKTLRGSDDEEFGKEALNVLMYAGHPYGAPVEGLVGELESVTLDDVRNHYRALFTDGAVTIGLAGGYDDALVKRMRKDLARLPDGPARVMGLPVPTHPDGVEVLAVDKECRATAISMGFPIDVTRADADFYPLLIANSYLGEHRTFNGRLMIRMRQIRGMNYGDYSYIENFIQEGGSTFPLVNIPRRQQHFSIWIRPVPNAQRHFAVRIALYELKQLVENGMSEADFEATRQFLKNYSRLWAQNQSRRLGFLMDARFYEADDILSVLPEKLDALTLDQVNAAIKKHLGSENMYVAAITKDADAFLTALTNNTPSPMTYESEGIPEDVLAEDKVVAVYPLAINRKKSRVVDSDEMFR